MNPGLIKRRIGQEINNIRGWRTNRKIVVFESDDWGSIRMPSKEVYDYCLAKGYRVDENIFSKYDSLASDEDLTLLFNTLVEFKDSAGRHPMLTANCLVANPDFVKIQDSNYNQYYYELITKTFERYPKHSKNLKIWLDAFNEQLFFPQSHGREHLNVSRFMNDLKTGNQDTRFAFELNMPGIFSKDKVESGNEYIVSLEHNSEGDKNDKIEIIKEGLSIFKDLFKRISESFIASNYLWHPDLEVAIFKSGVKYIQGSRAQLIPLGEYNVFSKKYHYTGQKNTQGQIYLVRNAYFEPTSDRDFDCVNSCLNQIETAFRWNKPAIISTHRINYVGYIDPHNRDKNLILFRELLGRILKKWPMVEFANSVELGNLITRFIKE